MAYIKKLKNNELIGGTDNTDVYPVTSTEAVYNKENVSQEYINNHVDGSKIVDATVTTGKIANNAVTMGKLDNYVQSEIQKGAQRAWNPRGAYNEDTVYGVNDLVYHTDTNSSYISLQANNQGHNPAWQSATGGWWMKVLDGSYVNLLEEELQQLVDSISDGTQQQVEELNEALEALEAQADQSRQDIQDIVDSLAVVQTTGDSTTDVMSQKAVTDEIIKSSALKIVSTKDITHGTTSSQNSFYDYTNIGLVAGKRYRVQAYTSVTHSNAVSFYLREVALSQTVKFNLGVNIAAGQNYSEKIIYNCTDASAQYLSMYTAANKASQFIVKFEEIEFEDIAQRILSNCCADRFCLNGHILKGAAYSPSSGAFMFQNLLDCTELIEVPKDSVFVNVSQGPFWGISCYDKDMNFLTNRSALPDFDRKIGWLDEGTRYISISFLKSENIDYANLFITFSDSDNYKICSDIGFKAGIMYSKAYNPKRGILQTFDTLDCTPALLVPESFSQIYKINCNKKFYQIACINANKEVIGGVSYPATALLANTKYISVSFLKTDNIDYSDLRISLVSNENSNENYSVIPTSRKQKKYYAFGDSITYWDSRTSWYDPDVYMIGYPSYMRNILGAEVVNEGVAGQTSNQITTRLLATNLSDAYAVTFMAGANDLNNSVPVGTIGQFDRSTYIGNLETAIRYVLTNYPQVKVYLLSPLWESHTGWEAYANAMQSVADYYGVPILRWDRISGLNTLTADTFYVIEGTSRVHPNNDGYARLADCLIPFLQSC